MTRSGRMRAPSILRRDMFSSPSTTRAGAACAAAARSARVGRKTTRLGSLSWGLRWIACGKLPKVPELVTVADAHLLPHLALLLDLRLLGAGLGGGLQGD